MTKITELLESLGKLSTSPLGVGLIFTGILYVLLSSSASCYERVNVVNSQWKLDHPAECKSSTYITEQTSGFQYTCSNVFHTMIMEITKVDDKTKVVIQCICPPNLEAEELDIDMNFGESTIM